MNRASEAHKYHSPPDTDVALNPVRWRILAVLLTAQFMSLVSVSILNVVLPALQTGLDATESDLQWVLSGYALAFGIVLVAAGRIGDIYGREILFLLGIGLFISASLAAGLAHDAFALNLARVVQGLGSGLMNPQIMGIIQQNFKGRERGRAYGMLGTIAGASVAVGPLLGGAFVALLGTDLGWRSTFWINVPIGLLIILLGLVWFPRASFRKRRREHGEVPVRDLDPIGALLLATGIFMVLFPIVQGRESTWVWFLSPLGPGLIVSWVFWELAYKKRNRSPMINLELFRIRSFSYGSIVGGLYYLGATSVWVLVAIYTQQAYDFSAVHAGLLGLPSAILAALGSAWAGKRVTDYGRKIVIAGTYFALCGLSLSVAAIYLHHLVGLSLWWLLLTLSLMGVAQGTIISPNQALTMMEIPPEHAGSAGGLVQTFQRVGTAVGVAVMTAIFYVALPSLGWDHAMSISFGAIGLVILLTLIVGKMDQRARGKITK
ncbi:MULTISPECIES: MFS transporter [unclassified Glutamicibacter]|uniref:MFS transporter n=1 Tax=unclassified Glutamicibacter TaxID=2627139 RepID=UPI00381362C0